MRLEDGDNTEILGFIVQYTVSALTLASTIYMFVVNIWFVQVAAVLWVGSPTVEITELRGKYCQVTKSSTCVINYVTLFFGNDTAFGPYGTECSLMGIPNILCEDANCVMSSEEFQCGNIGSCYPGSNCGSQGPVITNLALNSTWSGDICKEEPGNLTRLNPVACGWKHGPSVIQMFAAILIFAFVLVRLSFLRSSYIKRQRGSFYHQSYFKIKKDINQIRNQILTLVCSMLISIMISLAILNSLEILPVYVGPLVIDAILAVQLVHSLFSTRAEKVETLSNG